MKIDLKELRAAFNVVDQVDTNSGLLSSGFVRVTVKDRLTMVLTGMCASESWCPLLEPGPPFTWYIDRRMLKAFLSSSKAKAVTVDVVKDVLLWKAGRQKITSAAMDAVTGYTSWEPSKEAVKLKLSAELRRELGVHASYAPKGAADDQLGAVALVKGYGAMASDSFAISARLDKAEVRTLKLPVLLAEALGKDVVAEVVFVEKDGAGVRYPNGYLYQPLTVNAATGYPFKKLAGVVALQVPVKPVIKIKAAAFLDALAQMRGYAFDAAKDALIICSNSRTAGYALVQLDVAQGKAETAVAADFKGDFKLSWQLAKLYPWVEWISSVDPESVIACGQKDGCHAFSVGKYLLIVAETA